MEYGWRNDYMKTIVWIGIVLSLLSGCSTNKEEKVEENKQEPEVKNPVINSMKDVTEESIRLSAYNYMTAIELDVISKLLDGKLPSVYTNDSLPMSSNQPIKVEVTLKDAKVDNGTIEYEKYIVEIQNGIIEKVTSKKS